MNYKNINDYELINLVDDSDEIYQKIIYSKYEPLVNNMAYKYSQISSCEYEDLKQEAYIALCKSLRTYKPNRESIFYTYVCKCINNRLIDCIKNVNRRNLKTVSIYNQINNNIIIFDNISAGDTTYMNIDEMNMNENLIHFKNDLSSIESLIFELKYNGFKYKEIANLLDINMSKVNNSLRNIRKKLVNSKYLDCIF